jgi:low affinity Fe/Cu permease
MGDSGEGLIDAEARIQERMDERAAEREQRLNKVTIDPERHREIESLRLARAQLQQQAEAAAHPVRRQQVELALKDVDERIAALTGAAV